MVLAWRPTLLYSLDAIDNRLEAMALRLEAIALRSEAITIRLEAIAISLEAIAIRLPGGHCNRLGAIALTLHETIMEAENACLMLEGHRLKE